MITIIIDRPLAAAIHFYDVLNGLRKKWVTGNATLEVKLIKKITGMRQEVLYNIFIDIHKDYNVLDREQAMMILEGYRVSPRVHQIM